MHVLKKSEYYVIIKNSKPSLTSQLSSATKYNSYEQFASFIKHQVPKRDRYLYHVEKIDDNTISKSQKTIDQMNETKNTLTSEITKINTQVKNKVLPLQDQLASKVKYYDDLIQDLLHYLREPDTKLNACDACNFTLNLQQITRERESVKKELKRCELLSNIVDYYQNKVVEFDFQPYKPKVIDDFTKYTKKAV